MRHFSNHLLSWPYRIRFTRETPVSQAGGQEFMLRVIYRTCGIENHKPRPPYYSKINCLKNFIFSHRRVRGAEFCLLFDGEPSKEVKTLVEPIGRVEVLNRIGNAASFLFAIAGAQKFDAHELVYFVEDDYLHVPEALVKLMECVQCAQADYFTLYDHPVRYFPDSNPNADWHSESNRILITKSHHWRTVESTCMTFAARAGTLVQDSAIFLQHMKPGRSPEDRELFRHLQGLGKYRSDSPMRVLIGPVPSLATHCEEPWLAPVIDWNAIANER